MTFLTDNLYFGSLITVAFYALGLVLKKKYRLAVLNPILIAVLCVGGLLLATETPYEAYKSGAQPISYLLTPATVCLALPLYEKLSLLKKHWKAITLGILAGAAVSLLATYLLCAALGQSREIYATLLPKSITSAFGMSLSEELGGIPSVTVACIILSGIVGSVTGETVFMLLRVTSPIARGVGLGTASHAIGTAKAAEMGKTEAAMSSLALVICGILTTVAAPFFLRLM